MHVACGEQRRAHMSAREPGCVTIVEREAETLFVMLLYHFTRPPTVKEIWHRNLRKRGGRDIGPWEAHILQREVQDSD